jgi:hypothetical protein
VAWDLNMKGWLLISIKEKEGVETQGSIGITGVPK